MWSKAGDGVVGHDLGDVLGGVRPVGPEPVGRPVEGAEKCAGRDDRVGRGERAAADAGRDDCADPALIAIALGHDERAEPAGQRVDLEMSG